MWCWRTLLRVPWTARRSNQSILKEINLEYSLVGLMLKLKLQYLGKLMWTNSCLIGKDPDAGRNWGQEEKGVTGWNVWMASLTQWAWVWANSGRQWWTEKPGVLQFMGLQRVKQVLVTEWQLMNQVFTLLLSVSKPCPTLCDPMDCSMPDFPVFHYIPEFAQTHVHWIDDAIQKSHPLYLLGWTSVTLSVKGD